MDNVKVKLSEIAAFLGTKVIGIDKEITGISAFKEYREDTLTFYVYFPDDIPAVPGANVIVNDSFTKRPDGVTFLPVKNPKLAMVNVIYNFYHKLYGVLLPHDSNRDYHVIEKGDLREGDYCSTGKSGFRFVKEEDGTLFRFPHIGKVIIGDNVEIGSCVCIDRGSLSDTVIGDGTKIDNLVHVAHNVKIGKNCHIIAGSCLCGSCEIGDNTWIAPHAVIKESVKIGKNCLIGLGSVVTKDVPDNKVVMGVPGKVIRDNK